MIYGKNMQNRNLFYFMTVTHYIYYESIVILEWVCVCTSVCRCVFASGEMTGLEYNISYTSQDIYSLGME